MRSEDQSTLENLSFGASTIPEAKAIPPRPEKQGSQISIVPIMSKPYAPFSRFIFSITKASNLYDCSRQSLFLKLRIIPQIEPILPPSAWCNDADAYFNCAYSLDFTNVPNFQLGDFTPSVELYAKFSDKARLVGITFLPLRVREIAQVAGKPITFLYKHENVPIKDLSTECVVGTLEVTIALGWPEHERFLDPNAPKIIPPPDTQPNRIQNQGTSKSMNESNTKSNSSAINKKNNQNQKPKSNNQHVSKFTKKGQGKSKKLEVDYSDYSDYDYDYDYSDEELFVRDPNEFAIKCMEIARSKGWYPPESDGNWQILARKEKWVPPGVEPLFSDDIIEIHPTLIDSETQVDNVDQKIADVLSAVGIPPPKINNVPHRQCNTSEKAKLNEDKSKHSCISSSQKSKKTFPIIDNDLPSETLSSKESQNFALSNSTPDSDQEIESLSPAFENNKNESSYVKKLILSEKHSSSIMKKENSKMKSNPHSPQSDNIQPLKIQEIDECIDNENFDEIIKDSKSIKGIKIEQNDESLFSNSHSNHSSKDSSKKSSSSSFLSSSRIKVVNPSVSRNISQNSKIKVLNDEEKSGNFSKETQTIDDRISKTNAPEASKLSSSVLESLKSSQLKNNKSIKEKKSNTVSSKEPTGFKGNENLKLPTDDTFNITNPLFNSNVEISSDIQNNEEKMNPKIHNQNIEEEEEINLEIHNQNIEEEEEMNLENHNLNIEEEEEINLEIHNQNIEEEEEEEINLKIHNQKIEEEEEEINLEIHNQNIEEEEEINLEIHNQNIEEEEEEEEILMEILNQNTKKNNNESKKIFTNNSKTENEVEPINHLSNTEEKLGKTITLELSSSSSNSQLSLEPNKTDKAAVLSNDPILNPKNSSVKLSSSINNQSHNQDPVLDLKFASNSDQSVSSHSKNVSDTLKTQNSDPILDLKISDSLPSEKTKDEGHISATKTQHSVIENKNNDESNASQTKDSNFQPGSSQIHNMEEILKRSPIKERPRVENNENSQNFLSLSDLSNPAGDISLSSSDSDLKSLKPKSGDNTSSLSSLKDNIEKEEKNQTAPNQKNTSGNGATLSPSSTGEISSQLETSIKTSNIIPANFTQEEIDEALKSDDILKSDDDTKPDDVIKADNEINPDDILKSEGSSVDLSGQDLETIIKDIESLGIDNEPIRIPNSPVIRDNIPKKTLRTESIIENKTNILDNNALNEIKSSDSDDDSLLDIKSLTRNGTDGFDLNLSLSSNHQNDNKQEEEFIDF